MVTNIMRTRPLLLFSLIFLICFLKAQSFDKTDTAIKEYQMSSEKYISGDDGKVYMKVNFWGIGNSGTIQVQEGIDFASLMSAVLGSIQFANLKKIRLYRETPDDNGQLVYVINFENFLKTGDRSNFIRIKPNDTIIVPTKISMLFIEQIGTINTLLSLITIYLQFVNLFAS